MKRWIIAAAIVLASVSTANAERLRCEIVQVLPGFFLPQCDIYDRHTYRSHYRTDHDRWEYERGRRHNRHVRNHNRHNWDHYDRGGRPHMDRDIHDRPYRRDNHRW